MAQLPDGPDHSARSLFTCLAGVECASTGGDTGHSIHAAIIMDGSGRWAAARGLPRSAGHRAGVEAVRRTVQAAPGLGDRNADAARLFLGQLATSCG